MSTYHSRAFVPVTVKWLWSCTMAFFCNEVAPAKHRFREAARLGFEPRLTDPESFSFRDTGGHLGTQGDKTALLSSSSSLRGTGKDTQLRSDCGQNLGLRAAALRAGSRRRLREGIFSAVRLIEAPRPILAGTAFLSHPATCCLPNTPIRVRNGPLPQFYWIRFRLAEYRFPRIGISGSWGSENEGSRKLGE
jgi:hypothetical protein